MNKDPEQQKQQERQQREKLEALAHRLRSEGWDVKVARSLDRVFHVIVKWPEEI